MHRPVESHESGSIPFDATRLRVLPFRLTARTLDSGSSNRGSNPRGVAKRIVALMREVACKVTWHSLILWRCSSVDEVLEAA